MIPRGLLLGATLVTASVLVGCGGSSDGEGNVIRQDDASDEVWNTLVDLESRNEIMTDDAQSATLTAPEDGAELPPDEAPTFTWTVPADARRHPRHGVATGYFVWLKLSGGGLEGTVDVISVSSTSWTPEVDAWTKIQAATGPITVTLTRAYADNGVISEGPFRPTTSPTFSLAE